MPEIQSSRLCVVCGADISYKSVKAVTCSRKCSLVASSKKQEEKRKIELKESRTGRKCARCKNDISIEKPFGTKYCTEKCKNDNHHEKEDKEHKKLINKKSYERHKDIRREYARNYHKSEHGAAVRRKYRRDSEKFKDYKRFESAKHRNAKHDAHVRTWRKLGLDLKRPIKHNAHVLAFRSFKKLASNGWHARYWKKIGRPWKNPRMLDSKQYAIRYRLDIEFRLNEINRATWRKDILSDRDDGTINFWVLLRERKTCPYCGCKITKENAVADHMDPLKHGGANSQHNLTICCRDCNKKKSGKRFDEWIDELPDARRNAALRWYKQKHGHGPEQISLTLVF